jgi:hypothetical protein
MLSLLPESPTVDALALAAAMRRRFPPEFHSRIEAEMWAAIGDYWAICGGHLNAYGHLHILAPLPPIYAICPEREMALSC